MTSDFTTFDPNAAYNDDNMSDFMGFKARKEEERRQVQREVERMFAATCRCGHVGAECFNDSYCYSPNDTPNADIEWHKAQIHLKARIEALQETINDMQADYTNEVIAWREMYNNLSNIDYIEQLRTTIRVLSGMIDP